MKTRIFWLTTVVAVVALVASALLFVDYVRPAPVFCAEEGCGAIKQTWLAHPFLGIPMPAIGIVGILAIALANAVPGRKARIAQAAFAVTGAIVAAGLIGVQLSVHQICPFCITVDSSMIVLAVLAIVRAKKDLDPPEKKAGVGLGVGAAMCAVAIPIALGFSKKPIPVDIPQVLRADFANTPRGKITVIDFVDFECPFCRMTHKELEPIVEKNHDKVFVVRKNVPLRMHAHAMDAAKASCCAADQGKGDAMVEALFKSEDLTVAGCEKLASDIGADLEKFKACTKDPATEARIQKDIETFRAAKGHGLPTIYVGSQRLEGAQDRTTLEPAFDTALKEL